MTIATVQLLTKPLSEIAAHIFLKSPANNAYREWSAGKLTLPKRNLGTRRGGRCGGRGGKAPLRQWSNGRVGDGVGFGAAKRSKPGLIASHPALPPLSRSIMFTTGRLRGGVAISSFNLRATNGKEVETNLQPYRRFVRRAAAVAKGLSATATRDSAASNNSDGRVAPSGLAATADRAVTPKINVGM
jgi:hypothetical protein